MDFSSVSKTNSVQEAKQLGISSELCYVAPKNKDHEATEPNEYSMNANCDEEMPPAPRHLAGCSALWWCQSFCVFSPAWH